MPSGDIGMIMALGIAAAGLWAVRAFVRPANALGLSLFRPYRGADPWPRGVQEEYDVHFDWSPSKAAPAAPAPIQPTWSDIVVTPTNGVRDAAALVDDVAFEDLVGETAAISHVQGDVRIAPR